jgi:MHS family proline/betaine transporter-like MFS transporter
MNTIQNVSTSALPARILSKPVLAGVVGNVMEWYDFMLFAYFAPTLGKLFFPSDDATASLMKSYGIFAATFVMRPVGALLFGHIGDRLGRKRALELSVMAMAIPTFVIGLLPTHAGVGSTATLLLVVMRLLQGLAVGGEYTTSFCFVVEHAPSHRRGFHGALTTSGGVLGILLASLAAYCIQRGLAADQVLAWGWRVPFLLGILVASVGIYVRRSLTETAIFTELRSRHAIAHNPIKEAFGHHWRRIGQVILLNWLNATMFYVLYAYLLSYLSTVTHLSSGDAQLVITLALGLLLVGPPTAARISDAIGRRPVLLAGCIGTALITVPAFALLRATGFGGALAVMCILTVAMSAVMGPMPATLTELFPARARFSGIGIGHNVSHALFGGTAPFLSTWLVTRTRSPMSPAYYMLGAALVSAWMAYRLRESFREPITSPSSK